MQEAALKIIEAAERSSDVTTLLIAIRRFDKVEMIYRNSPDVSYGNQRKSKAFEDAVRSGEYICLRPHQIAKKPERGTVYCACAAAGLKRGQVKLGHTTLGVSFSPLLAQV